VHAIVLAYVTLLVTVHVIVPVCPEAEDSWAKS